MAEHWYTAADARTLPGIIRQGIVYYSALPLDDTPTRFVTVSARPRPHTAFVVVLSDRVLFRRPDGMLRTVRLEDIEAVEMTRSGDLVVHASGRGALVLDRHGRPEPSIVAATGRAIAEACEAVGHPVPLSLGGGSSRRAATLGRAGTIGWAVLGLTIFMVDPVFAGLALVGVVTLLVVLAIARLVRDPLPGGFDRLVRVVGPFQRALWVLGLALLLPILGTLAHRSAEREPALRSTAAADAVRPAAPARPKPKPAPDVPPAEPLVEYRVFDVEVHDSPLKTQVSFKVVVPAQTSRGQLDVLMRTLHDKTAARTGFRYHPRPTAVYAYVFYDEQAARSHPAGWVGSIQKAHADDSPSFINHIPAGGLPERVAAAIGESGDPEVPLAGFWRIDAERRLHVVDHLTDTFAKERRYTKGIDKGDLWFAVFWRLERLYLQAPDLSAVRIEVIHRGRTIADVTVTRAVWDEMDYGAELERVGAAENAIMEQFIAGRFDAEERGRREERAHLAFYARCLARIPRSDKKIAKGLAP